MDTTGIPDLPPTDAEANLARVLGAQRYLYGLAEEDGGTVRELELARGLVEVERWIRSEYGIPEAVVETRS